MGPGLHDCWGKWKDELRRRRTLSSARFTFKSGTRSTIVGRGEGDPEQIVRRRAMGPRRAITRALSIDTPDKLPVELRRRRSSFSLPRRDSSVRWIWYCLKYSLERSFQDSP